MQVSKRLGMPLKQASWVDTRSNQVRQLCLRQCASTAAWVSDRPWRPRCQRLWQAAGASDIP